MGAWAVAAAALIGLGTVSVPARAEGEAPDRVSLIGGEELHGTVVAIEPEVGVTILLPGGDVREVPWAELDDVEGHAAAAPAPPAPPPPKPAEPPKPVVKSPPPAPPVGPRVTILSSDNRVELIRVGTTTTVTGAEVEEDRAVCGVPCGLEIDLSGARRFYVGGQGIVPSSDVELAEVEGDVTVRVNAGSAGMRFAGWFMLTAGGTASTTGAVLLGMAASNDAGSSDLSTPGGVTLGMGAVVLAMSVVMLVGSSTEVTLSDGEHRSWALTERGVRLRF